MILRELIRTWRDSNRFSYRVAARKIGIHHDALWRFEKGRATDGNTWVKILCWLFKP